ncbi:ROK family protein [Fibrella forsythiae]|uniref:ROK family protein n=1 Tax=Fibrella forsythiae TaxID=2817061 RepID=A0ABS3JIU2_9BACT|nr:ROK family protein [Fibrella forsythiae]MBO0949154.1 ROK family protein [Fibrella forsythiae]
MAQAIGIDLGGTRIKGVLINPDTGEVEYRLVTNTGDGSTGANWQLAVAQTVQTLTRQATEPVAGIGLSAPGLPTPDNRAIACMPGRLQGLEGFDWSAFLVKPVRVLNDAHAALMAEARFGALAGIRHGLMLTLGTGVGGGLLLNGQLYQGFYQMAGHLGHITVNADSSQPDITNVPGSLEDAIGNVTVGKRSFGRYHTTHELVAGYQQGEPLATQVWLTSVRHLAVSIASLANAFSPEVVVLGGGIMQADKALLTPLETFMDVFEWRPAGKKTTLRKAHFDDWSGAIGAAAFLTHEQTV